LQTRALGARFSPVHRNVHGMLWRLNEVGYVVLDVGLTGHDSHEVLHDIRALDGTIRATLVYEN
jgi:D-3-phosphoglycerate dehydrogenase / 2-oxoglutarate reductase